MKPWKRYTKNDFWAVVANDGHVVSSCVSYGRNSAITEWLKMWQEGSKHSSWRYWYKEGYRAQKVTVVIRAKKAKR